MANYKAGDNFDGFQLKKYIGSGVTAEVWKVIDKNAKEWALKIIAPGTGLEDYEQNDLKEEYNKTAHLSHPNILIASEYGYYNNRPYLVLELCNGSLTKELKKRYIAGKKIAPDTYFSEKELAEIIAQTAAALNYLHSDQINLVHLDVKPANILVRLEGVKEEDEKFVLSDFGITKEFRQTVLKKTQPLGNDDNSGGFSPAYAAPEQFDLRYKPRKESDVFALGVTIYELATGKLPSSSISIGQAIKNGDTPPELPSFFSTDFKDLIKQCMALSPEERPSAGQLQSLALRFLGTGQWKNSEKLITKSQERSTKKIDVQQIQKKKKASFLLPSLGVLGLLVTVGLFYLLPKNTNSNYSSVADSFYEDGDIKMSKKIYQEGITQGIANEELLSLVTELEKKYYTIRPFRDNLAAVYDENGWGFINKEGEEIINCQYTSVSDFKNSYASVSKSDLVGVINTNGKIVVPIEHKGTIKIISPSTAVKNVEGKSENLLLD